MPSMLSAKWRCMFSTLTARIIEPKPSTVPMRVSALIVGPANALAQQELRLRDVREHLGPQLERRVEDLGAELLAVRLLPRLRRGHAVLRARRHVRAVVGEAAVTAHTAGDERLGDAVVREQLGLGPVQLEVAHGPECKCRPASDPATRAKPRRAVAVETAGATTRDAQTDAGVDLGELVGRHHRPQRRDRDLELVEIGLAGRELLQQQAGPHQRPHDRAVHVASPTSRITS